MEKITIKISKLVRFTLIKCKDCRRKTVKIKFYIKLKVNVAKV